MQQLITFPEETGKHIKYYHLGDKILSPLSYWSLQLLKVHLENIPESKKHNILWLGFPNRNSCVHFLAVGTLTELFRKDLQEGQVRKDLKPGMTVCLFNTELAEYGYLTASHLHVKLNRRHNRGYGMITEKVMETVPAFYADYCKPYTGTRTRLSTLKKVLVKARERMHQVKPIDRVLLGEKVEDIRVPSGILKSKIMILTGKSSKSRFSADLEKIRLFDTEATEVFRENLLVKRNPEDFMSFFSTDEKRKRLKFNRFFLPKLQEFADLNPQMELGIEDLSNFWEKGIYEDQQIEGLKNTILYYHKELPSYFNMMEQALPLNNPLPPLLKIVLVNHPSIYEEFQNTLMGMAESGIKICVLFGAEDYLKIAPEIYSDVPKYFWNRNKIKAIGHGNEHVIDGRWFGDNLNYSRQQLCVSLYDDQGLSDLYWKIYQEIKDLEGEEKLKHFFWNVIFPSFHIIKNSPGIQNYHIEGILLKIEKFLDQMRNNLDIQVAELLEKYLNKVTGFQNKKKQNSSYGIWGGQEISLDDSTFNLPFGSKKWCSFDEPAKCLSLGGIPFRDFEYRFVERLLFKRFVTKIEIGLWTREYYYLKNIMTRYSTSPILKDSNINNMVEKVGENFPRQSEDYEFLWEIKDFRKDVIEKKDPFKTFEQEEELAFTFTEHRHSKYKGSPGDYTRRCFVVQLRGNKWLYLPKEESSLTFIQEKNAVRKIKNKDIQKGVVLVLFKLKKEDIRRSGEADVKMDEYFKDLEVWERALRNLYVNSGRDYGVLKERLEKVKDLNNINGSPEEYNLRRWLNEEDLTLNPRPENLKMILTAAGEEDKFTKVLTAAAMIRKYEKRLRKEVQKEVINQSEIFFNCEKDIVENTITANGVEVRITTCIVSFMNKETLEIDYANIRKIKAK